MFSSLLHLRDSPPLSLFIHKKTSKKQLYMSIEFYTKFQSNNSILIEIISEIVQGQPYDQNDHVETTYNFFFLQTGLRPAPLGVAKTGTRGPSKTATRGPSKKEHPDNNCFLNPKFTFASSQFPVLSRSQRRLIDCLLACLLDGFRVCTFLQAGSD